MPDIACEVSLEVNYDLVAQLFWMWLWMWPFKRLQSWALMRAKWWSLEVVLDVMFALDFSVSHMIGFWMWLVRWSSKRVSKVALLVKLEGSVLLGSKWSWDLTRNISSSFGWRWSRSTLLFWKWLSFVVCSSFLQMDLSGLTVSALTVTMLPLRWSSNWSPPMRFLQGAYLDFNGSWVPLEAGLEGNCQGFLWNNSGVGFRSGSGEVLQGDLVWLEKWSCWEIPILVWTEISTESQNNFWEKLLQWFLVMAFLSAYNWYVNNHFLFEIGNSTQMV